VYERSRHALALACGAFLCAAWLPLAVAAQVADPTQPPSTGSVAEGPTLDPGAVAAPGAGRLTAIVVSPSRRLAVIDGIPVRVGDEVGATRVIEIEPLSVRLRGPDGEVVLSIAGPPVKGKKP
jgi:hypothetical protein